MIEEATIFISKTGFPIFVASYLLFRFDKTISENTRAINSLMTFIKKKV